MPSACAQHRKSLIDISRSFHSRDPALDFSCNVFNGKNMLWIIESKRVWKAIHSHWRRCLGRDADPALPFTGSWLALKCSLARKHTYPNGFSTSPLLCVIEALPLGIWNKLLVIKVYLLTNSTAGLANKPSIWPKFGFAIGLEQGSRKNKNLGDTSSDDSTNFIQSTNGMPT